VDEDLAGEEHGRANEDEIGRPAGVGRAKGGGGGEEQVAGRAGGGGLVPDPPGRPWCHGVRGFRKLRRAVSNSGTPRVRSTRTATGGPRGVEDVGRGQGDVGARIALKVAQS